MKVIKCKVQINSQKAWRAIAHKHLKNKTVWLLEAKNEGWFKSVANFCML